jgi:UDP-glucose 4-epimerase
VYGKNTAVPFSEEADLVLGPTTKHRWAYACSKAIDEFLGLAYHKEKRLPVVVARLFNTVGPRQTGRYGMVVPNFVKQALLGHPLAVFGDGTQTRCFTYVTDVVGQLVALAEEPRAVGEVFNIGNDREEVTILDLARRVLARAASKSPIELVPYDRAYEEGFEDMLRRVPDLSKLRALTGYEPRVHLDEILDRVIAYFTSDATRL